MLHTREQRASSPSRRASQDAEAPAEEAMGGDARGRGGAAAGSDRRAGGGRSRGAAVAGAYSTMIESGRQQGRHRYAGSPSAAPAARGGKSFEAARAANKHILDGLMSEFRHTGPALQFRDTVDTHRGGRTGASPAKATTMEASPALASSPQRRRGQGGRGVPVLGGADRGTA